MTAALEKCALDTANRVKEEMKVKKEKEQEDEADPRAQPVNPSEAGSGMYDGLDLPDFDEGGESEEEEEEESFDENRKVDL